MEEERVIIESKSIWAKKLKHVVIILLVACLILAPVTRIISNHYLEKANEIYDAHHHVKFDYNGGKISNVRTEADSEWSKVKDEYYSLLRPAGSFESIFYIILYVVLPVDLLFLLIYLYCSKMSISVSNKRVYGKSAFGKRVDLPIDSISAVGAGALKGLSVGTSAGKITFIGMDKRDDVHKEINKLLIGRQQGKTEKNEEKDAKSSNADELKKYKELLDSGIITQEEFDAKKKQLLGL